jgi:hypothetical protein
MGSMHKDRVAPPHDARVCSSLPSGGRGTRRGCGRGLACRDDQAIDFEPSFHLARQEPRPPCDLHLWRANLPVSHNLIGESFPSPLTSPPERVEIM